MDMEAPTSGTPDLATVLKTLSSFHTPANAPTPNGLPSASESYPDNSNKTNIYNQRPLTSGHHASRDPIASPSRQDSSSITTWSAALKHVTKTVAQNEATQYRIRRLITAQHEHERTWWQERQKLVARQKARAGNQKKLDDVLRAVGGKVTDQPYEVAPHEDKLELKQYDDKVYNASAEMSKALDKELQVLEIPFFNIRPELIRPSPPDASPSGSTGAVSNVDGLITPGQLATLRRRILELLEDLCRE